jgi:hypothetical protein
VDEVTALSPGKGWIGDMVDKGRRNQGCSQVRPGNEEELVLSVRPGGSVGKCKCAGDSEG